MLVALFVLGILGLVYYPWFLTNGTLASGDWPYLFKETIQDFSFTPNPAYLWLGAYYQITSKIFVEYFYLPWELAERVLWFWLFLVISFFSSWYLSKVILHKRNLAFFSALIFTTNTYILMVIGGGQIGVALGYSLAPLVFAFFFEFLRSASLKKLLIGAVVLGLQVMFDPRIAYVTGIGIAPYSIISWSLTRNRQTFFKHLVIYFFSSGIVVFLINYFWIAKNLFTRSETVSKELSNSSIGALQYLSFGTFSQSFSLSHPNWPENIFGKTYFLRFEFLILPIIAFTGFLFIRKEKKEVKKTVLFFAFLILLGAFLAKGAKEPFAKLYEWMFLYIPGFVLFRDPTKFYTLVALSYALLIPFSAEKIAETLSKSAVAVFGKKIHKLGEGRIKGFVFLLFICLWGVLMREAVVGQLSGTFKPRPVPQSYIILKDFLNNDTHYSQVAWVPTRSPFSFFSKTHPILDSVYFTHILLSSQSDGEKISKIAKENNVKYIIIPEDTEGKIFQNDRKYDEKEYIKVINFLKKQSFVIPIKTFGKIIVFEIR